MAVAEGGVAVVEPGVAVVEPGVAVAEPGAAVAEPGVAVAELRFRVMASEAQLILVEPAPGAEDHARRRLAELERRWSRFLPGSEVSRLNTAPDALMLVSPDTLALIGAMKDAWRVTGGRYDPTMLGAIIAAGYETSIDGSGRTSHVNRRPRHEGTIADVTIDPVTAAVVVPAGVGLDPGGIGKGLAADLVVTELLEAGTRGALVGVGGDLAAAGTPPTATGWRVVAEHPLHPTRDLATFDLNAGGVATSSTLSRAWLRDGCRRHHAIDPHTRTSATTDLAAVTVIARAGWEAEAHATAALLGGSERVLDYLTRSGLEGVAATLDGTTMTTPALRGAVAAGRSAV